MKIALPSPRMVVTLGAVVVAVATWYVAQSNEMSALLFVIYVVSSGVARYVGQDVLFVVMAFVGMLLFLAPIAWRRTPTSAKQVARFSYSTCLWLLAYLVALFWFGEPGEFSL